MRVQKLRLQKGWSQQQLADLPVNQAVLNPVPAQNRVEPVECATQKNELEDPLRVGVFREEGSNEYRWMGRVVIHVIQICRRYALLQLSDASA